MVVQEDDTPVEAPVSKQTKKYVIVKNHIRELMPEPVESSSLVSFKQQEAEMSCNKNPTVKNKHLKRKKLSKETNTSEPAPTDISQSDIEELRTVYKKCKEILIRMKSKYGHLLDLDDEDYTHNQHQRNKTKLTSEESGDDNCSCSLSKKIIFDENGQQIEKVCQLENHICPKKIKLSHCDQNIITIPQNQNPTIQIEYDQCDKIIKELPDNFEELSKILKNPNIDNVYRKMVIDKVYMKRQEHMYEMRNERKSLVEQLKINPDQILAFKGTNMSILPGYPKQPLDVTENK